MALLFMEGFENREPLGRNFSFSNTSGIQYVAGRMGGWAVASTSSTTSIDIPFVPTTDTVVVSFAIKPTASSAVEAEVLRLLTGGGSIHFSVKLSPSRQLTLDSSSPGDTATSSISLDLDTWSRIDIVARVAQSGGYIKAYINGILACELVDRDTMYGSGSHTVALIRLWLSSSAHKWVIDDLYALDSSGPAPYNDRLGDVRIETISPAGNGTHSEFLGSDGNSVDNYQLLDELPASAADYVVSSSVGDKDTYSMTDLSDLSQVLAVQPIYLAYKTDSGSASLIPIIKLGATEQTLTTLGLGTVSGQYVPGQIVTVDPDGNPWNASSVNAAEFGFEAGA